MSHIKSKTKTRTGIEDLKRKDGSKTENDKEKADLLNQFFQSVFTAEGSTPLPDPPQYEFENVLEDITFTVENVRKTLAGLNTSKASGPDEINH